MSTIYATHIDKNSDGALIAATKRGDRKAFEELVRRHERRVFVVAQRITKNREDAEDVVQESFHNAFVHLDDFQQKSLFSTWLTRIAMNQALMVLRRRRRFLEVLPECPDEGVKSASEVFIDRTPNPEESCWRRERTKVLTQAINRLTPIIRRTVVLRDIEERSVEETARIVGASIAAVKSRISRGRRNLSGAVNLTLA
jgi:RNA polymerase sigma-70 factor, ECF subfamily